MALGADFSLGPLDEEVSPVLTLGQLEAGVGLFHYSVAIGAGKAAHGMGARRPVSLRPALVALQATLILHFSRLAGIFSE